MRIDVLKNGAPVRVKTIAGTYSATIHRRMKHPIYGKCVHVRHEGTPNRHWFFNPSTQLKVVFNGAWQIDIT